MAGDTNINSTSINQSISQSTSTSIESNILQNFVINIGTKVDEKSQKEATNNLKKIQDNVLRVSKIVVEGFATIVGIGTSVVYGTEKIAAAFDKLYYAAQRSGTSVQAMKALGYAAEQMGVDGKDAAESLANIARFMRNNAAGEGILNGLGIGTREANGELRDTKDILIDVLARLQKMPQFQANRIAEMLGVNENLRLSDLQQLNGFMKEASDTAKEFGVNLDDLAVSSNQFETNIRRLGLVFDIIKAKVLESLAGPMKAQLDELVAYFKTHKEEIIDGITKFTSVVIVLTGVIFKAVIGFSILISKVSKWYDDMQKNHPVLLTLVKAILSLVAAIGLIEVAPFAAVAAAITGLITLVGYLTYQWDAFTHGISTGFHKALIAAKYEFKKFWIETFNTMRNIFEHGPTWLKIVLPFGTNMKIIGKDRKELTPEQLATMYVKGDVDAINKEEAAYEAQHPESAPAETRGNRNNNPGNIKFAPWERAFGATGAEANGPFAQFGTMEQGLMALQHLLQRYSSKGLNTVSSIISTYAPGNENNTAAYIADVAKNMGVGANSALDLSNPATLDAMMKAISRHEGTYNAAIGAGIDKVTGITITQTNTFHIDGSKDPEKTAAAVSSKLGATANIRNLKQVVQ